MKLISLWEPWATLMAIGAKRIETRSWQTSYRGWLAIHASKNGLAKAQLRECLSDPFFAAALNGVDLTPGHIVAVVELKSCIATDLLAEHGNSFIRGGLTPQEMAFGDYHPERFGWVTDNLFRLPHPIPYKASQGLCDVQPEALAEIRRQWKESRSR